MHIAEYFAIFCVIFVYSSQANPSLEELPPTCFSDIYCHGRLLDTIQMARINKDSKTFVDMKLRRPPNETIALFDQFMDSVNQKPTRNQIIDFVNTNFEEAGEEFEEWIPGDWVAHPKFIDDIKDETFKQWALNLNAIWKILGRKMKDHVKENQNLYSIIWVPNPVIVPGGRFREFYYWDSYWIVQGLLLSEMYDTVKGMLENFLYIVDHYGHIPNGGRIYYLARSQPPLLVPMIKAYYEHTRDVKFIQDNIHLMEKEFHFWMKNHTRSVLHDGVNYTLAVFGDYSYGPRPESYSEDVDSASIFPDRARKEAFYSELKAGAESGWDFSSRWFVKNATDEGNLTNTKARSIIPVDLNALIYWNADLLSEFYELVNHHEKAELYKEIATEWRKAVDAVLWHDEIGAWLDYDTINEIKRDYFYPTNIAPLWTGCYDEADKERKVRSVIKYLRNKNVLYAGGVPSTLKHTGEQWDYPNAWPPLNHLMIVGLNNTGNDLAVRLAEEIAETWVRSNYKAYNETDAMFEKYDATVPGGHGGGGEYDTQVGFGWSNGVIMDLLHRYGSTLRVVDPQHILPLEEPAKVSASSISSITTVLLILLISLTAGFIGVVLYKRHTHKQMLVGGKRPTTAKYTELKNIPKNSKSGRSKAIRSNQTKTQK